MLKNSKSFSSGKEILPESAGGSPIKNSFLRIGQRAVVVCSNNLSYAGIIRGIYEINNESGGLLEIDPFSKMCVWIPLDFVKEITLIPIPE